MLLDLEILLFKKEALFAIYQLGKYEHTGNFLLKKSHMRIFRREVGFEHRMVKN